MGYCPYFCVCCGTIEDNGWGSCETPYYKRVEMITEKIGEENCKYLNYTVCDHVYYQINDPNYPATEDVCNTCFYKRQPKKKTDPFFLNKHTKEERREYWKNHCKKTKI